MQIYLDFNSESKPVITKEKSLGENSKTESAQETVNSKIIMKSRSISRSMSPHRRQSRSRSHKRSSHSKTCSNKSPMPYGFIFSASTERLQSTP